jgi:hypothetical protein
MMLSRSLLRMPLVALLCLCSLTLALGCGRRGAPKPKVASEVFAFSETSASVAGDCLSVQGLVTGSIANVARIDIEAAPVRGPEDCPACPFTPVETGEFSVGSSNLDMESGHFVFSYCPHASAQAQRWRIVGRNTHPGMPHTLTMPQVTVMQ